MKTPLYDTHVALGARMAPFAGWDMPIQYEGILTEHMHTRRHASLFDTCHMGEFEFSGPSAAGDLDRLVTQHVSTIHIGQCRYGYLLNENGGVLDDLTVFRRTDDCFFVVVNAGTRVADAEWMATRLSPTTRFEDLSPQRAKLDVQGPQTRSALEAAIGHSIPDLKYFRFVDTTLDGVPCTLSRTGYTGEWGYEIFFPIHETQRLWERLLAGGVIKPAGLGARDTLRLEVGYPLYGHELSADRSPVAATHGQFIERSKEFIGKAGVLRDLEQGTPVHLTALQLDSKRAARTGDKIFAETEEIGWVTSGSLAPSLGYAVALGYVRSGFAETGQEIKIRIRGVSLPATVVELPFYRHGTARRVG